MCVGLCMCVHACTHVFSYAYRDRRTIFKKIFFSHMGPEVWTQGISYWQVPLTFWTSPWPQINIFNEDKKANVSSIRCTHLSCFMLLFYCLWILMSNNIMDVCMFVYKNICNLSVFICWGKSVLILMDYMCYLVKALLKEQNKNWMDTCSWERCCKNP